MWVLQDSGALSVSYAYSGEVCDFGSEGHVVSKYIDLVAGSDVYESPSSKSMSKWIV
jgi:hypothetical protein